LLLLTRHPVTIELDDFGYESLQAEAKRQGVTLETLVEHAAMYYLGDLHSGRAAVQIFRRSVADSPARPRPRSVPEPEDDQADEGDDA
jgi:hypothetical protein